MMIQARLFELCSMCKVMMTSPASGCVDSFVVALNDHFNYRHAEGYRLFSFSLERQCLSRGKSNWKK